MQTQQQDGPGDRLTLAGSFNAAYRMAHCHALTCTVFLRTDFGREGISLGGLVAGLLILGYGSFANCYPMFIFFLLWVGAVICQRLRQFRNWQRGAVIHSRYNGYPFISKRLFPRTSEPDAKCMDGFICLVVGGLLAQFNQPLGFFIMAGFLSIMFSELVTAEATKRRLQMMRDAEIEQRYLAEQYKSGQF